MTADELLATYSGLGTRDGENYYKGEECLACVKDLIRFLRDDELVSSRVRRHLGQARILQRDLIPILSNFHQDKVVRNDVLKLMLNLTLPAHLVYGNELVDRKKDVTALKCYSEVEAYLRDYKEAFASEEKSIAVLVNILADHLKEEWHSRQEEDCIAVERVLVILRNILYTPVAPNEEKRTDDDCNLHDQLVWNLHSNACHQLLLYLSSSPDERSLCLTVLEILYLIFRQSSPEDLVRSCQGRNNQQLKVRSSDSDALANLVEREMNQKKQAIRCLGARHSRFGGTFEVFSDKSLSEKNRIHHAPLSSVNSFSYDTNKKHRRKAKKFRPIEDDPSPRASISSVRRALGELALGILEHSYNPFMKSVRGRLMHDTDSSFEYHYDTYYLWAIQFFMEFNRLYSFRLDFVRETLDVSIFTYLIRQVYLYQEMIIINKEDSEKWGRRLHRCLSALKELLSYLQAMQSSDQNIYRENAKILQSNIFYMSEFREMFPSLLREYRPTVQTRSYLASLMDSLHLFIRLLEKFTHGSSIVVQRKGKILKKKISKKRIGLDEPTREQLEIEWDKMQYELLRILEAESRESEQLQIEGLFDATRHEQEDEQKQDALSRTQACLRRGDMESAVATLRAAREIWPRDDFGPRDSTCIDELRSLKDIYLQPLVPNSEDCELLLEDEELEEAVEIPERKREGEFDLFTYSLKFCNQKIIKSFSYLLTQYSFNSDFTNHALVKMLHRICYQCKKFPLLYQISLFSVFQFILEESSSSRYKELKLFVVHVLNRFFSAARNNPCLFVEILFWKSQEDCVDIELGYGTVATMRESKVTRHAWSEEDTTQLTSLWEQYKGCEGVLGEIAAEMTNKAELQIKKKLVSLGLADKIDFKIKSHKKSDWSAEEDERLRELYSVYGEQADYVQVIASHFSSRSETEVKKRIKRLGIGTNELDGGGSTNKRVKKKKRLTDIPADDAIPNKKKTYQLSITRAISLYKEAYSIDALMPGLEWLGTSLRREAVDRELDPEWEAVPLVPNNLALGQALESSSFIDLMRALSLTEPDTGQMFWRIPSEITPKDLITCADIISGKLTEIPTTDTVPVEDETDSSEPSELLDSETSECSQLSAGDLNELSNQTVNSLQQKTSALAELADKKKLPTISQFKSKEFVFDSDLSDLESNSQVQSLDEILVPSPPPYKMKPSVKRLYNSDTESDGGGDGINSQPLHSKLQRMCTDLSEDSDLEPDHLSTREEVGAAGTGGRGKRARLDSDDSDQDVSSPKEERSNLKKVRYIQESESDDN